MTYAQQIEKLKEEAAAEAVSTNTGKVAFSHVQYLIDRCAAFSLAEGKRQQHEKDMEALEKEFKTRPAIEGQKMQSFISARDCFELSMEALASVSPESTAKCACGPEEKCGGCQPSNGSRGPFCVSPGEEGKE